MPDLWDVLESHGMRKEEPKEPVIAKQPEAPPEAPKQAEETPVKRIILKAEDARKLFVDLPKQHRFWLKSGKKVKNLMELYEELKLMPEEIFCEHVSEDRNDFARWVREVYKDSLLAKQLESVETREEHIVTIGNRIEDMKSSFRREKRTYIQPNLQFLRKSFDKPELPKVLETRRRIVPKTLRPDFSFIKLDEAYVIQQKKIKEEMLALKNELKGLESQVISRKKELVEVMDEISAHQKKANEMAKEVEEKEKVVLLSLKEKEKALQTQLGDISGLERKILSRADHLLKRERDILRKHMLVMQKQEALRGNAANSLVSSLASANEMVSEGKLKEARLLIARARHALKVSRLSEEEKQDAYVRLQELSSKMGMAAR